MTTLAPRWIRLCALAACFALPVPALAAEVVRMGDLPAITNAGLYIAIEKGYFQARGITVETERFASAGKMVAPLATGQGFARAVAREVGSRKIRVNAICPGCIDTPMTQPISDLMRKTVIGRTPLGRYAEPAEVAQTALFLASDDSSFFTGQRLSPNGGLFIG